MALTYRGPVEQQKQPQSRAKETSSYNVTHERIATDSRPAG